MDQKKIELIGIVVDIRNSTKMIEIEELKRSNEIISEFITNLFRKAINKDENKIFKDRSRHQGDGVILTIPRTNDKNFSKTFNLITHLNEVVKEHNENNTNYKAGIGLDYDWNIETNIKDSPSKDKSLIVGNSISRTVKICSQVPFEKDKIEYIIKASKNFITTSKIDENNRFEVKWNGKKNMAFIRVV